MDPRLLRAYNDELAYLREAAREFGEEHAAVAGRLGLNAPGEPDPFVERLLEGVAFLGARVSLKLQDQFPDFTMHLLNAVQPHYIAPTPSMCVVEFQPAESDAGLARGLRVPRLTALTADAGSDVAQVTFRTGHDVELLPLRVAEAEYLPSRAAVAPYDGGARAEAGLRLRLAGLGGAALSSVGADRLPLFLAGGDVLTGALYRQLIGDATAAVAVPAGSGAAGTPVRLPLPEQYGFGDECALIPPELRSFRGYRLLSEYFACPERFLFVELRGLARAFARADQACDVVILFGRAAPELAGLVTAANFRPFATPAINLFEKQLSRVPFSPRTAEHQLVPDRTRPLDFEVFRVLDVTAYADANTEPRPVVPLYARGAGAAAAQWDDAINYVPRLRPRRLSTREQRLRRRSDYVGSETWLSLTAPFRPELLDRVRELAVRALVTNRELPERLGDAAFVIGSAGVNAVRVLRPPTRPRPPLGMNDAAWRLIGHLTPNYAALITGDGDPALLREHLLLYGRADDPVLRRHVDGLLSISGEPITRRVPGQDRLAFARGMRIDARLDDGAFENGGMFLFAAVLERFLAEFTTVNSFTEAHFSSQREGRFADFPLRTGQKPLL